MSDTITTHERVESVIASHLGCGKPVDFNCNIFDDLGADQLDEIEILMELEEEFGIEIPDDDYETPYDFLWAVEKSMKA